jgi:hypothetical protein
MVGPARTGQVTHDPDDADPAVPLGVPGLGAQAVPPGGLGAVAAETGVQVQVDAGAGGGTGDRVEVIQARDAQFDVQPGRGGEVGAGRVEPAQDPLGQARLAQRSGLVDSGDAEAGRAPGEGGPGDVDLTVAEAVGLDHRHHLAGRTGPDGAHVGGDRAQVDVQRRLRPQGQKTHRRTGPYSAASAPVASAQ